MPNDLPPWYTVYQQPHCLLEAAVFEKLVCELAHVAAEIGVNVLQSILRYPSEPGGRQLDDIDLRDDGDRH